MGTATESATGASTGGSDGFPPDTGADSESGTSGPETEPDPGTDTGEPECAPAEDPFANGAAECGTYFRPFEADPGAPGIAIEIVNRRDRPIALFDDGCSGALFRVDGEAAGGPLEYPSECGQPLACADANPDGPGAPPCDLDCEIPRPVFLPAGGSVTLDWDAVLTMRLEVPEACLAPGEESFSCAWQTHAVPGAYMLSARAATAWACEPGATCSCEPPGSRGWCHLDAPITPGNVIQVSVETSEPCDTIRLEFD